MLPHVSKLQNFCVQSLLRYCADIGWSGGNAIAPQLFQARWAPRYLHSLVIHLVLCMSRFLGGFPMLPC